MVEFMYLVCQVRVTVGDSGLLLLHLRYVFRALIVNFPMYLVCQVRVTVGDSGLCCCTWVACFER